MKKDIADRWVKALRSGEYKQGRGFLKVKERYCCLGVLCDLYDPKGWKMVSNLNVSTFKIDHNFSRLSKKVMTWSGMRNDAGCYEVNHTLIKDNDRGDSFEEIANTIEKEWEEL